MTNFNSHRTLILNSTFQPLSVASAKRSVALLLGKKINVIKTSKLEIRSENKIINIPKVALLTYYVKAPYARRVALNRSNIFIRDFNTCQYCGNNAESIDHIIPKSRNGSHSWDNVVTACMDCNHKKAGRTPKEANMKLKIKPFIPNLNTHILKYSNKFQSSWDQFLTK